MSPQRKMERLGFEADCVDGGEETRQYDLKWVTVGVFSCSGSPVSYLATFRQVTDGPVRQILFQSKVPLDGKLVTPQLLLLQL